MNSYTLIIFLFGLVYLVITPPFQVPDAQTHFYRAYQVSTGEFIAEKRGNNTGGDLPFSLAKVVSLFNHLRFEPDHKSSLNDISQAFKIKLDSTQKIFINFENTAVFSPIPYIPAALGIYAGSLLTDSVLIIYYLASLFTLIAAVFILTLAIRVLPDYDQLIFSFCVLPMFMFQLSSLSSDSLSNAISVLFVCQIFSITNGRRTVSKQFFIEIIVTGVALALCKQTYSILFMLTALLTPQYFKNKTDYLKYQISFFLIISLSIVTWTFVVSDIYSPLSWIEGADVKMQLAYVIENPLRFFNIVMNDLQQNSLNYIFLMGGTHLGWVDTEIPTLLIVLHLLALVILGALINSDRRLTVWQYLLCLLTIICGILTIELALYLHAQPVGSTSIIGIHGRYFLHLFFVFLITITTLPRVIENSSTNKLLVMICTVPYLVSIPIIVQRYYLVT